MLGTKTCNRKLVLTMHGFSGCTIRAGWGYRPVVVYTKITENEILSKIRYFRWH